MEYKRAFTDYNHVGIVGRLLYDAKIKQTGVMWFYIQYEGKYYDKSEDKTKSRRFNVMICSRQLDIVNELTKGTRILVDGRYGVLKGNSEKNEKDFPFVDASTITILGDTPNNRNSNWDNLADTIAQGGIPASEDNTPEGDLPF